MTRPQVDMTMPLTGRESELAAMRSSVAAGSTVAVLGPAGVGKTRLCRELLRESAGAAHCIWLPVTEAAVSLPLGPVAELLADGAGADRQQMFAQAAAALQVTSAGRPCIIGVDDAHLLDADSAGLLRHLAMTGAVLVLSIRSSAATADQAAAHLFPDLPMRSVRLAPLQPAAIGRLLDDWLNGPVLSSSAAWFADRSAGYPLELRELVLAAVESECLERVDDLWLLRREPAPSARLRDLVQARITSLPEKSRAALEELAVAEPLPRDVVAATIGEPTLAALCAAGLAEIFSGAARIQVRTAHPIIGEVVRATVPAALQRRLRARLATAMSSGSSQDRMRAVRWQLDAGVIPDPATALEAAAEASRQHDHESALTLSAAALDTGGAVAQVAYARALVALNRSYEAVQVLQQVDGTTLAPEAARDLLGEFLAVLGIERRHEDYVSDLLDRAEQWHAGPEWARVIVSLRVATDCIFGRLISAADRGRSLAPVSGRTAEHVHDLSIMASLYYCQSQIGHTKAALEGFADLLGPDPAATLVEHPLGRQAFSLLVLTCINSGTGLASAIQVAQEIRNRSVSRASLDGAVMLYQGRLYLARGQIRSAARLLREAVAELGRSDPEGQLGTALGGLALAQAWAGDPDNAALARVRAYLVAATARYYEIYLIARAEIWCTAGQGRLTRAAELAWIHAQGCGEAFAEEAHLLHDAVRLGRRAAPVLSRLITLAGGSDNPLLKAYADHALAAAASDGAALSGVAERFAAMTLNLLAAEAASEASAAHRAAGESGSAVAAARRAAEFIGRCEGARTPAMLDRYPHLDRLTRRERETVLLAVRGVPRAKIAAMLEVSVRTVDSHLYGAMRKMRVRDRAELISLIGSMLQP